ncbi:heptaprenyl diphosphate synthase component 1 [Lentibacillus kapialis]|uniref:Heptaprenyl diphosphate synthase component 1 n=1 Tax=Lentibacillus kapialis TaxID=340214 RepID=A0A917PP69_9BACI|nr:heptaprenyl diphosphate synthase component 1 [Lentibacillus kapialis]GGJ85665.1 heptaprenyl diphosphate synthase component 1 [Lentibacillus kapialis]
MQTSSMEINRLKSLIKEKMNHAYIEQYVKTPALNEDKLYILIFILNNTALSEYKKERYIVTAMLVQMALDTHDLVPESDDIPAEETHDKSKQLAVLAGDYYSGLYYYLLSEIEEVRMIQVLATAIRDINECKMQLYYQENHSFETFIHVFKQINTLLITRIAAYTNESDIGGIAADWLILKKLINIRNRNGDSSLEAALGFWATKIPANNHKEALYAIDSFIQTEAPKIEKYFAHFPAKLSATKSWMTNALNKNNNSMAEEG